MTVSGDEKQLALLQSGIVGQDKELLKIFIWFEKGCYYGLIQELDEIKEADGDINLDFTTKWSPPETSLLNLSKAYPLLHFNVQYEESGLDVYGVLEYFGGECVSDKPMLCEEYLSEYDEEYIDCVEDIDKSEYKDFLSRYLDESIETLQDDPQTCRFPALIEKRILKRVKDKDLPLLIGHKWISEDNQEKFESRLKGTPLTQGVSK
jgi:hypothetical protein